MVDTVFVTVSVCLRTLNLVVGDTSVVTLTLTMVVDWVKVEVSVGAITVSVDTLTTVDVTLIFFGFTLVTVVVRRSVVVKEDIMVIGDVTVISTVVNLSETVVTTRLMTFLVVDTMVTGNV